MLGGKLKEHKPNVWLVNTGWSGGAYGEGKRIKLDFTRAMITAALNGSLNSTAYVRHSVFGLEMPATCPEVPTEILNPKNTWNDKRKYDETALTQVEVAQKLYGIYKTIETVFGSKPNLTKAGIDHNLFIPKESQVFMDLLLDQFDKLKMNLDPYNWEIILTWEEKVNKYKNPIYSFKVRDKVIEIKTHSESLSHSQIPKVALPKYQAWCDNLKWN